MAQSLWQKKTCPIWVRLHPDEYARFNQYCKAKGIPMAKWLKDRVLEAIAHEPYPETAERMIVVERRAPYGEVRKTRGRPRKGE